MKKLSCSLVLSACLVASLDAQEPLLDTFLQTATQQEKHVVAELTDLHQMQFFLKGANTLPNAPQKLKKSVDQLVAVDAFYRPLGGLSGYTRVVKDLLEKKSVATGAEILPPPFIDLRISQWNYCFAGNTFLPQSGELYVVGGAGDRLNLVDPVTKMPQPAAKLIFLGKTLLERLFLDLEAREYWYYKNTGKEVYAPVVLMTSQEKNNDQEIEKMCVEKEWFGRPQKSINRMIQPQVPLIDKQGNWVVGSPLEFSMKPGGHGVVWKLGYDEGIFPRLQKSNIQYMLVKQINNPLLGIDMSSFAMLGAGALDKKAFGLASCPQRAGFAEGMIVLKESNKRRCITNIEYTDFETLKKEKPELFNSDGLANVNFLFANLTAIQGAVLKDPFPGLLVNAKTEVENAKGEKLMAARLESTMQNIVDNFTAQEAFVELFPRDKIISAAKRAYVPGKVVFETPVSCLYDLATSNRKLLLEHCKCVLPVEQTIEEFIAASPNCFFDYHPALGPLWNVIGQKIQNIQFHVGSRLNLAIAEVVIDGLQLKGACEIRADSVTKHDGHYSDRVGRVVMKNVTVNNNAKNDIDAILQGTSSGGCLITLHGMSELMAENVVIPGDFSLEVPDRKRAILSNDSKGEVVVTMEDCLHPTWKYHVKWEKGHAPKLTLSH